MLLKTRRLNPLRPYKVLAWDDKTKQYQPIKAKAKLEKDGKTLVLKFANTASKRFKIVDVLSQN
ncbi:MAG TPA: hypothetical protein ENK73_08495 [Thiomicrospira sp.]|nr:hypothetical protein [Thiomicrospira sp.]